MPVSAGRSFISSVSASMPPAEAPTAAIGKLSLAFALLAAWVSAIGRRLFRVDDFDFIVSPTAPSPMATEQRMVSRAGLVPNLRDLSRDFGKESNPSALPRLERLVSIVTARLYQFSI